MVSLSGSTAAAASMAPPAASAAASAAPSAAPSSHPTEDVILPLRTRRQLVNAMAHLDQVADMETLQAAIREHLPALRQGLAYYRPASAPVQPAATAAAALAAASSSRGGGGGVTPAQIQAISQALDLAPDQAEAMLRACLREELENPVFRLGELAHLAVDALIHVVRDHYFGERLATFQLIHQLLRAAMAEDVVDDAANDAAVGTTGQTAAFKALLDDWLRPSDATPRPASSSSSSSAAAAAAPSAAQAVRLVRELTAACGRHPPSAAVAAAAPSARPPILALWADQFLKEQMVMLDLLLDLFYEYVQPSPDDVVAIYTELARVQFGWDQATRYYFSPSAAERHHHIGFLAVVLAIELLSLESAARWRDVPVAPLARIIEDAILSRIGADNKTSQRPFAALMSPLLLAFGTLLALRESDGVDGRPAAAVAAAATDADGHAASMAPLMEALLRTASSVSVFATLAERLSAPSLKASTNARLIKCLVKQVWVLATSQFSLLTLAPSVRPLVTVFALLHANEPLMAQQFFSDEYADPERRVVLSHALYLFPLETDLVTMLTSLASSRETADGVFQTFKRLDTYLTRVDHRLLARAPGAPAGRTHTLRAALQLMPFTGGSAPHLVPVGTHVTPFIVAADDVDARPPLASPGIHADGVAAAADRIVAVPTRFSGWHYLLAQLEAFTLCHVNGDGTCVLKGAPGALVVADGAVMAPAPPLTVGRLAQGLQLLELTLTHLSPARQLALLTHVHRFYVGPASVQRAPASPYERTVQLLALLGRVANHACTLPPKFLVGLLLPILRMARCLMATQSEAVWPFLAQAPFWPRLPASAPADPAPRDPHDWAGTILPYEQSIGEYPVTQALIALVADATRQAHANYTLSQTRQTAFLTGALAALHERLFPTFLAWRYVHRRDRLTMGAQLLDLYTAILTHALPHTAGPVNAFGLTTQDPATLSSEPCTAPFRAQLHASFIASPPGHAHRSYFLDPVFEMLALGTAELHAAWQALTLRHAMRPPEAETLAQSQETCVKAALQFVERCLAAPLPAGCPRGVLESALLAPSARAMSASHSELIYTIATYVGYEYDRRIPELAVRILGHLARRACDWPPPRPSLVISLGDEAPQFVAAFTTLARDEGFLQQTNESLQSSLLSFLATVIHSQPGLAVMLLCNPGDSKGSGSGPETKASGESNATPTLGLASRSTTTTTTTSPAAPNLIETLLYLLKRWETLLADRPAVLLAVLHVVRALWDRSRDFALPVSRLNLNPAFWHAMEALLALEVARVVDPDAPDAVQRQCQILAIQAEVLHVMAHEAFVLHQRMQHHAAKAEPRVGASRDGGDRDRRFRAVIQRLQQPPQARDASSRQPPLAAILERTVPVWLDRDLLAQLPAYQAHFSPPLEFDGFALDKAHGDFADVDNWSVPLQGIMSDAAFAAASPESEFDTLRAGARHVLCIANRQAALLHAQSLALSSWTRLHAVLPDLELLHEDYGARVSQRLLELFATSFAPDREASDAMEDDDGNLAPLDQGSHALCQVPSLLQSKTHYITALGHVAQLHLPAALVPAGSRTLSGLSQRLAEATSGSHGPRSGSLDLFANALQFFVTDLTAHQFSATGNTILTQLLPQLTARLDAEVRRRAHAPQSAVTAAARVAEAARAETICSLLVQVVTRRCIPVLAGSVDVIPTTQLVLLTFARALDAVGYLVDWSAFWKRHEHADFFEVLLSLARHALAAQDEHLRYAEACFALLARLSDVPAIVALMLGELDVLTVLHRDWLPVLFTPRRYIGLPLVPYVVSGANSGQGPRPAAGMVTSWLWQIWQHVLALATQLLRIQPRKETVQVVVMVLQSAMPQIEQTLRFDEHVTLLDLTATKGLTRLLAQLAAAQRRLGLADAELDEALLVHIDHLTRLLLRPITFYHVHPNALASQIQAMTMAERQAEAVALQDTGGSLGILRTRAAMLNREPQPTNALHVAVHHALLAITEHVLDYAATRLDVLAMLRAPPVYLVNQALPPRTVVLAFAPTVSQHLDDQTVTLGSLLQLLRCLIERWTLRTLDDADADATAAVAQPSAPPSAPLSSAPASAPMGPRTPLGILKTVHRANAPARSSPLARGLTPSRETDDETDAPRPAETPRKRAASVAVATPSRVTGMGTPLTVRRDTGRPVLAEPHQPVRLRAAALQLWSLVAAQTSLVGFHLARHPAYRVLYRPAAVAAPVDPSPRLADAYRDVVDDLRDVYARLLSVLAAGDGDPQQTMARALATATGSPRPSAAAALSPSSGLGLAGAPTRPGAVPQTPTPLGMLPQTPQRTAKPGAGAKSPKLAAGHTSPAQRQRANDAIEQASVQAIDTWLVHAFYGLLDAQ